jgi:IclR family acetate operon transcriptional repressor
MQVVERVFQLLDELGRDESGVGVTRLAERLALPPSTVHRLLSVLAERQLVVQDPDVRSYRLGPAVLRLGDSYQRQNRLITVGRAYLASLEANAGESAFLTELINDDAICVATAESYRPLRFFMRVGQRMPYHAAASARAILAFQPLLNAERLLRKEKLDRFTEATPTTIEQALEELARVRQSGYAVCDQEIEVGVAAISVPVRHGSGRVSASLSIIAPHERLAGERKTAMIQMLLDAANGISTTLGYRPPQVASSQSLRKPPKSRGLAQRSAQVDSQPL